MIRGSSFSSFLQALRERKVFAAGIAYLVIAFGLVEASELVLPRLGFPLGTVDVLVSVLAFLFPIVLAVAWRVGGESRDATPPALFPVASLIVVTALFWWLGIRAVQSAGQPDGPSQISIVEVPLVIMMDSPHPDRVYDEETLQANGTNADVISDILLDLPVRRQRETIGPRWHRDEEILRFDPDLVVIHYSGFLQDFSDVRRERLKLFLSYFVDTRTQFLVYSRQDEVGLRAALEELLAEVDEGHPGFLARVHVFGLPDHGAPNWRDPLTANALKLRVKEILDI